MPSGNLELSGERVLDVTVAGEDVVNVVSVAVDSGLVLARTFRYVRHFVLKPKGYHLYRVFHLLADLGWFDLIWVFHYVA